MRKRKPLLLKAKSKQFLRHMINVFDIKVLFRDIFSPLINNRHVMYFYSIQGEQTNIISMKCFKKMIPGLNQRLISNVTLLVYSLQSYFYKIKISQISINTLAFVLKITRVKNRIWIGQWRRPWTQEIRLKWAKVFLS